MIYITGDTHGDFSRYKRFMDTAEPTTDDVMIILGDVALNFFADERDEKRKYYVNSFPFTTFCIQGNHDLRPEHVSSYKMVEYRGGMVWREDQYPNIVFARDGEIYDFEGKSCIVIGGAYSVDKYQRLLYGYRWFEDEQPSDEIKAYVEEQLKKRNWKVDIVLSHTCPLKCIPMETLLKGYDEHTVDRRTEEWLDSIEDRLDYQQWYCGHFHTSKKDGKMRFMYEDIGMMWSTTPCNFSSDCTADWIPPQV